MDNFPERLKTLAKNRVFAITAVLFFAFLTAFILVLLSSQTHNPSVDELRTQLQNGSRSGVGVAGQSGTNGNASGGVDQTGTSTGNATGSTATAKQQKEIQANAALAQIVKNAASLPKVQTATLDLKTSYPTLPDEVKVYTFKTNYSEPEVLAFARQLGVTQDLVQKTGQTMSVTDRAGNTLSFDRKTGAFFFASKNGLRPSIASASVSTQATNFLKQIGVFDDTMIFTSVYRSPDISGSQLVEFHRDWNKVGFPIFDLMGIYNLPASRSLQSVRLAETDSHAPAGTHGNYFNTATVEVDASGNIKSVTSSIRRIQNAVTVDKSQLRTPQEALTEAQSGRAVFSLSVPTGSGFIDINKVYPGNTAVAQNVPITDFIAAYWENNTATAQTDLAPYYLLCGNTTLASGYGSRICHAVPLLASSTTSVLGTNTGPLDQPAPTQINTSKADSLQYGTFGFTGTGTETKCPTNFTNSYKVGPGQYIAWIHQPPPLPRQWFLVLTNETSTVPVGNTEEIAQAAAGDIATLLELRTEAYRRCRPRLPEICGGAPAGATIKGCYYIMTGSPSVYLYPTTNQSVSVTINPFGGVSYANPEFTSQTQTIWKGTASPDGTISLVNSLTSNNLYYEFDRTKVAAEVKKQHDASRGYLVKTSEVDAFISSLAENIGLTPQEKDNLSTELKRETASLHSDYLKISFVDRSVLDRVLPLEVSPAPQTEYRLMLFVESANGSENMTAPKLEKIIRNGFTLVETGVLIGI